MQGLIMLMLLQQKMMNSLLCQAVYLQGQLDETQRKVEALEENVKAIYGIKR